MSAGFQLAVVAATASWILGRLELWGRLRGAAVKVTRSLALYIFIWAVNLVQAEDGE